MTGKSKNQGGTAKTRRKVARTGVGSRGSGKGGAQKTKKGPARKPCKRSRKKTTAPKARSGKKAATKTRNYSAAKPRDITAPNPIEALRQAAQIVKRLFAKLRKGTALAATEHQELRRIVEAVDAEHRERSWRHLAATEIASLFGVSARTVYTWHKGGCPRGADKTYDLASVIQWRHERVSERPVTDRDQEDADLKRVRREILELQRDRERGELIELDTAIRLWSRLIVESKTRLLSLPDRITLVLPTKRRAAVRPDLIAAVDDVLKSLAEGTSEKNYR